MIVKSDIRSIKGYNDINGVHIVYNVEYKTEEQPSNVNGWLEINDERIGTVSIKRNNEMFVSFSKSGGLSLKEQAEVITGVLSDVDSVFNPTQETTETTTETTE